MTTSAEIPPIPDHAVLRMIGRGSYGEIWLARGLTGAYRAVKVVYRSTFENERSFAREFEGMSSFEPVSRHHEGFVDILHVGRTERFFYYIMELADDDATGRRLAGTATEEEIAGYAPRTLKAVVDRRRHLPVAECLALGVSVAEALDDLHSHRLTHRDIKPANIIFVDGRPKLADIGLVASVGQRSYVGTEGYVPPEGPGSPAADVYSLGKVLYEVAMGKDRMEFPELATGLDGHPDRGRLLSLNQVLLRACANKPSDRYKTGKELAGDLAGLETGRRPRRRWKGKVVLIAGVLLLCGVAAMVFFKRQMPRGDGVMDLRIDTEPAGAMVLLGDRMEKSPAVFESVEAGSYPLRIMMSGYDPVEVRVDTTGGGPGVYKLTRSVGKLAIAAEPAGAGEYEVEMDGTVVRRGEMPGEIAGLPTGRYAVTGRRGGRTVREEIEVTREREGEAVLVFAPGRVGVRSDPAGAEITVDGTAAGKAPMMLDLTTGGHEIVARYGSWPESRMSVDIQRGENAPVEFAFHNGSVKITSAPGGATVLRGGMELGRTPLLIDEVEPGRVEYELRLAGYKPAVVTGTVAARGQAFLAARLEMKRSPEPGKPWQNSLGMRFVPMGAGIYFSVWDTRVSDYGAYCAATGRTCGRPDFAQGPTHPVVLVSWVDAEGFCKWLTEKERQEGTLEEGQAYRLPTDAEWSAADGLPPEGGTTPEERDGKMRGVYPWGSAWPPPAGSGNFADRSAGRRGEKAIEGYNDGFAATSPVDAFPPNKLGLYDMAGNVWQWMEDGYRESAANPRDWGVLRGGSWGTSSRSELESCYRCVVDRGDRDVIYGFRCVLGRVGE